MQLFCADTKYMSNQCDHSKSGEEDRRADLHLAPESCWSTTFDQGTCKTSFRACSKAQMTAQLKMRPVLIRSDQAMQFVQTCAQQITMSWIVLKEGTVMATTKPSKCYRSRPFAAALERRALASALPSICLCSRGS